MRLTELKIEKRKDFSIKSLGPFQTGLNFVYGERGAGKTKICNRFRQLYSNTGQNADDAFQLTALFANDGIGSPVSISSTSAATPGFPAAHHGLIENVYCVGFNNVDFSSLAQLLARTFDVQPNNSQELARQELARIEMQRSGILQKIQQLESELASLGSQREQRLAAGASIGTRGIELENQIRALTMQLSTFDAATVSAEIANCERELARLRAELNQVPAATVESPLPALYRTLDETEIQARELRALQLQVQQYRVRLKEEMEKWKNLSMDQQVHPYHNTKEILQNIESRIDSINSHAGQWAEDHSAVESQMVQRFLGESCQAIRTDLQNLCDELSVQYREIRQRSATLELRQLRENYSHLEESVQRILARRSAALEQIRTKDPVGARAIDSPTNEYSRIALNEGNFRARSQVVGSLPEVNRPVVNTAESGLRSQQIQALESRLATLRHTASNRQHEIARINQQITQLRIEKDTLVIPPVGTADLDSRIETIRQQVSLLRQQLANLKPTAIAPPVRNPVLDVASRILASLTAGDYTRIEVEPQPATFAIADRGGRLIAAKSIAERGLGDIVRLAIVLAVAQSESAGPVLPLVFDDLFAEIQKQRISPVLGFLDDWCKQNQRQIIVLTQHRFLADRLPASTFFDIESGQSLTENTWQPVTSKSVASVDAMAPSPIVSHAPPYPLPVTTPETTSWDVDHWPVSSVAEYPQSPLPRPYPLSKYPRSTDRQRYSSELVASESTWADYAYPTPQITVSASPVSTGPVSPVASIGPSQIASPTEIICLDEQSLVENTGMFNAQQLRCLGELDVVTVGDFLSLVDDPANREMTKSYLIGDSLSNFQSAAWLMMWVPGLSSVDSQALVACGISEPSHLLTSNLDSLYERVSRFLRSTEGRKYSSRSALSRESLGLWQDRLRSSRNYRNQDRQSYRSRSRRSNGQRERSQSQRNQTSGNDGSHELRAFTPRNPEHSSESRGQYSPRPARMNTPTEREYSPRPRVARSESDSRQRRSQNYEKPRAVRQTHSERPTKATKPPAQRKLKFYLDLTDHIEAAPSIGPRTAERFEAIGVQTISEFLKVTAEALAERLDYKRLSASVLRQWQHQARLVCRIPNLRGHDAQLLVGCGIVDAEVLASMRPDSLFAQVGPFSDTKEGLKIIRNGKKPDLAEVTDWIEFAQHNRSLQAA